MILTLTGVVLLALGAICLYLAKDDYTKNWTFCMGFFGIVFGAILLCGCVIVIISTHVQQYYRIQQSDMQRETIELQLEKAMDSNDTLAQNKAIDNARKWNARVFEMKAYSKNLWVSWFYDQEWVDSLEYIEVEDGRR